MQVIGLSLVQLPCPSTTVSSSLSCLENGRLKYAMPKNLLDRFHPVTAQRFPRRHLLQFLGFKSLYCCYPVLADMKEPEIIRTFKLASGVIIQDIVEGNGPEAHEGDLVEINYVCRRANGYFVHSTVDQFNGESTPVRLPLDEKQIIEGLKEVLVGMSAGGKRRRALIPPSAGYVNENLKPIPEEFGPWRSLLSHADEPLIFEVQLVKVL